MPDSVLIHVSSPSILRRVSFARPGGNITDVSCLSSELAIKRVELLKAAVPTLRRIGFLYDPKNAGKEKELADVRESATKLGMSVSAAPASAAEDLREAIASLRRDRAEALLISEDVFTFSNRVQIVALAAEHQMVDISSFREFVLAGGVLSYGADLIERLRLQARYAGPHGSRRQAFGPADRPADAVRVCREPEGGTRARHHHSASGDTAGRRRHSMKQRGLDHLWLTLLP